MTNDGRLARIWREAQASQTRLNVDTELLLNEVRRKQQAFTAMIFWRDVREVGASLLLIPVWIFLGFQFSLPWTWFLTVPACVWIFGFMLVDRMRHQRPTSDAGESLTQRLEISLAQVVHQIWLLHNIFWWYLLPFVVSILAFFVHVTWQTRSAGWMTALSLAVVVFVVAASFTFIYWLNQLAVRTHLEPRRQELESMLNSLKHDTSCASPASGGH